MTVVELARQTGLTPEVIRYCSRIDLLKPLRNPARHATEFVT